MTSLLRPPSIANDRETKRLVGRYNGHNRKPGAFAFLKDLRHRHARRRERRYWRNEVRVDVA